ncbi:MAG TPA: S41 family peptidase [Candidatus Limnocylindrales bacterium]|nr:S41 family peptidase [Candidatus Limnocylindrales bacterium]
MGFVQELIRLLGELPQDGLVVDIRGNSGGYLAASELSLQALACRPVEPEPAQLAATALNLRICRAYSPFDAWKDSVQQALESGAPHSAGIPLTCPKLIERVPQSYFGPTVLLTDARCYWAADIFAAGFQDNDIGLVLGTDNNIGAGAGTSGRCRPPCRSNCSTRRTSRLTACPAAPI